MRHFVGSVGVRGSVRGPYFTRHRDGCPHSTAKIVEASLIICYQFCRFLCSFLAWMWCLESQSVVHLLGAFNCFCLPIVSKYGVLICFAATFKCFFAASLIP